MEYLVRFLVGGLAVSAFAIIGDMLRPKSFAGLFSAAPSIALATLAIAIFNHGASYAAVQTEAMILGAVAFLVYSIVVCQLLMRLHWNALRASLAAIAAWLATAFGLYFLVRGGA